MYTDFSQQPQETPEERYNSLVEDLVTNKGFSKRKAKRYLDAYAKREHARIIKEGKVRQEKLRQEGKLVDTTQDKLKLAKEFEEQLKEIKTEEYQAKTSEF